MQHIMQIAFDFDDDKAREVAEKTLETDMDHIIKGIILDKIAPEERNLYTYKQERNWEYLYNRINERVDAVLKEYKDEIIDKAADRLVDCVKRTKKWKERYKEVLDVEPE